MERPSAIAIAESDLQYLLRTEAVVSATCALMLKSAGIEAGDVERAYVAGGISRKTPAARV